jgi:hypothetical protein
VEVRSSSAGDIILPRITANWLITRIQTRASPKPTGIWRGVIVSALSVSYTIVRVVCALNPGIPAQRMGMRNVRIRGRA